MLPTWLLPANEYYGEEHYASNILVGNEEVTKGKKGGGWGWANNFIFR